MGSRIALVTGATAGIGRSFAHQLAQRDHDLVIVANDSARLDAEAAQLRGLYGIEVETIAADLTNRDQLAVVEGRLADIDRPIDLLVNNAGFGLKGRFLDNPLEDEQALLDILVVAVMRLSHVGLSAMAARGQGGLINVASVAAFLPRGSYGAAKSWVRSFGEWASAEYRDQGITVTTLCPGFTRTDFHAKMDVGADSAPESMWLEPDDLVHQALLDHDDRKALSVPGTPYKMIVAFSRLVPPHVLQGFQALGRR